jgi:hypothetical protein
MTRAWLADVMSSPSSICKPLTMPINLCLTNASRKNAVHVVHVLLLKEVESLNRPMLSVKWAKKPMSILDLLSVAPFYVIMAMSPAQGQGEGSPSVRFSARLRAHTFAWARVDISSGC